MSRESQQPEALPPAIIQMEHRHWRALAPYLPRWEYFGRFHDETEVPFHVALNQYSEDLARFEKTASAADSRVFDRLPTLSRLIWIDVCVRQVDRFRKEILDMRDHLRNLSRLKNFVKEEGDALDPDTLSRSQDWLTEAWEVLGETRQTVSTWAREIDAERGEQTIDAVFETGEAGLERGEVVDAACNLLDQCIHRLKALYGSLRKSHARFLAATADRAVDAPPDTSQQLPQETPWELVKLYEAANRCCAALRQIESDQQQGRKVRGDQVKVIAELIDQLHEAAHRRGIDFQRVDNGRERPTATEVSRLVSKVDQLRWSLSHDAGIPEHEIMPTITVVDELRDRPRRILQAMLLLGAVQPDMRKTKAEIILKAEGPDVEPDNANDDMADLVRRGLIRSKTGKGGGYFLTPAGKRLAQNPTD